MFIPQHSGAAVSITCIAEGTSVAELTFTKEDGSSYVNDGVVSSNSDDSIITKTTSGLCRCMFRDIYLNYGPCGRTK